MQNTEVLFAESVMTIQALFIYIHMLLFTNLTFSGKDFILLVIKFIHFPIQWCY